MTGIKTGDAFQQVYTSSQAGAMAVALAKAKRSERAAGGLLSYGIPSLEDAGLFLNPGGMTTIAAMPGECKSALAQTIVRNVLAQLLLSPHGESGRRRVVFLAHTEQDTETIWAQMSMDAEVTPSRIYSGTADIDKVVALAAATAGTPLFTIGNAAMSDTQNPADSVGYGALTMRKIIDAIWRVCQTHDVEPALIVIDHMHDLRVEDHESEEEQRLVSLVDRAIVDSVRSFHCHTIVVAQCNEKSIVGKRSGFDRMPERSDIRYSNTIVQKSGLILTLLQPSNGHVDENEPLSFMDMKGRNVVLSQLRTKHLFVKVCKERYAKGKITGRMMLFSVVDPVTGVFGNVNELPTDKFPPAIHRAAKKP